MDYLLPIGGVVAFAFLAYAVVAAARGQREKKSGLFRTFAEDLALEYTPTDDGAAKDFGRDLDGIGVFSSPSLGDVEPKDLVSGSLDGMEVVAFRHRTRIYEGYTMEWSVVGLTTGQEMARRCSVQLLRKGTRSSTMYLTDGVIIEVEAGPFRLVVRAPELEAAGSFSSEDVLARLAELADRLRFRPDIQVRGKRIAVYPAGRNDTVESTDDLIALLHFAQGAVAAVA